MEILAYSTEMLIISIVAIGINAYVVFPLVGPWGWGLKSNSLPTETSLLLFFKFRH